MLKGDISNLPAVTVIFNFENVLLKECKKTLFGREKWELSKNVVSSMCYMFRGNYKILIVSFKYSNTDKVEKFLDEHNVLYSGVYYIVDDFDLVDFIREQDAIVYYDSNKERLNRVYPYGRVWINV